MFVYCDITRMALKEIGYVVGGLILLIMVYKYFKKSSEKYYKKAVSAHKLGEKYYTLGDVELADEYYKEADDYRQKAEALKEVA